MRLERDATRNLVFAWARPCSDSRLDEGQLADARSYSGTRHCQRHRDLGQQNGLYSFLFADKSGADAYNKQLFLLWARYEEIGELRCLIDWNILP